MSPNKYRTVQIMEQLNIQPIIDGIKAAVKAHEIEGRPGEYRRWLFQNEKGERGMDKNEYGCADAMNLLYTINDFYCDDETRKARIEAIQSMQNPETGLFHEKTHHPYHTVAHCTAALQLFDAKPLYPIKEFHKYLNSREELFKFLEEGTRWVTNPWRDSHLGAGVYAALVNSDEITPEFSENYFEWFRDNCDPETGFWTKGVPCNAPVINAMQEDGKAAFFQYMAAGFHYLFNHEYAKQPLPYPESMIDSCIKLYTEENALPASFGLSAGFIEIDWVFCLTRAMRQTNYRYDEGRACLEDFAVKYVANMTKDDYFEYNQFNDGFQDLHCLFGMACCLAELQQTFPGKIVSDKPLKLVLDRRPFI